MRAHPFRFFAAVVAAILMLSVWQLPAYVHYKLQQSLHDVGYSHVVVEPVKWSDGDFGLTLAGIRAESVADLPALNIGRTQIWLEYSRLWALVLGVRMQSQVLQGQFELRLLQDILLQDGQVELRLADIALSDIQKMIPASLSTTPLLQDKNIEGQAWLNIQSRWHDWGARQEPWQINASIRGLAVDDKHQHSWGAFDALELKNATLVRADSGDYALALADVMIQGLSSHPRPALVAVEIKSMHLQDLLLQAKADDTNISLALLQLGQVEMSDPTRPSLSLALDALQLKNTTLVRADSGDYALALADVMIQGLSNHPQPKPVAAEIKSMHLQDLLLQARADDTNISLSLLQLEQVEVGDPQLPLLSLALAQGKNIAFTLGEMLRVDDISLSKGEIRALRDAQGQWPEWRTFLNGFQSQTHDSGTEHTPAPLKIRVAHTKLENIHGRVLDAGVEPVKTITFALEQAAVENIALQQASSPMQWLASGNLGVSGLWKSDGALWLDDVEKSIDANITLQAIDLSPFSQYSERSFGSGIRSGNFDINITAKATDGVMNVEGDLLARKLNLKASDSFFDVGKDWSLASAVDVLRDSDDNVALQFSVEGKLADPSFKLAGLWDKVLKEAVQRTTISYLTQMMQPYGLAYTVGQYIYQASKKIELRSLVFIENSTELDAKSPDVVGYSSKILGLLEKKKALILEVCPTFVAAEQDAGEKLSLQRVAKLTDALKNLGLPLQRITVCQAALSKKKNAKPSLALRLM